MRNWKFKRLFKSSTELSDPELQALVSAIRAYPANLRGLPAGYTYFGQFVAHDLSSLRRSTARPRRGPVDLPRLKQDRKPALDLDSLYGGGLDDSVVPYGKTNGMFRLGKASNGAQEDLPRRPDGRPLIADARNDENLLVAQMHLLFMKFHNRLVKNYVDTEGGRGVDHFEKARREVVLSYQWAVLHDFAQRLLPTPVYREVLSNGRGKLLSRKREFPRMPIEFAAAAFRLGHSMVAPSYIVQRQQAPLSVMDIFDTTGRTKIDWEHPLQEDRIVDWDLFFEFKDYHDRGPDIDDSILNDAMSINPSFIADLQSVPQGRRRINLVERNLRRGRELNLATGQEAYRELSAGKHKELALEIGLTPLTSHPVFDRLPNWSKLKSETPLWIYVLAEAEKYSTDEVTKQDAKPWKSKLGPLTTND